jgi:hypothetical protein
LLTYLQSDVFGINIEAVRVNFFRSHQAQTVYQAQRRLCHRETDYPDAKANKAFCIKVGTTVTFSTSSKNTGFVIDFGKDNPFDHEGSIIGGADRPITVIAKHPGCYTYSIGACTPGTVYGMCGNADAQLIISAD